MSNDTTIGFIGTGVITEAIITGMATAGCLPERLLISRRNAETSARLAAFYPQITVLDDNQQIAAASDLLFLAVRPQIAERVLSGIRLRPDQAVASLIAGFPVGRIVELAGAPHRMTRVVPMPPVSRRAGITVLSGPDPLLEALFDALGGVIVAETDESFDALTLPSTVMGLYFGLQQIISDRITAQGTNPGEVRRFLAMVCRSLAETAESDPASFDELRLAHSTPGGLNEGLFAAFLAASGDRALTSALDQTLDRITSARSPASVGPKFRTKR